MKFSKFHDSEEIGRWDLADAFEQMWEKKRYVLWGFSFLAHPRLAAEIISYIE